MSFPFTHLQLERPFIEQFKVRCPAKLRTTFQVESTPTRAVLLKHHKLAGTALGQSCMYTAWHGQPFPSGASDIRLTDYAATY